MGGVVSSILTEVLWKPAGNGGFFMPELPVLRHQCQQFRRVIGPGGEVVAYNLAMPQCAPMVDRSPAVTAQVRVVARRARIMPWIMRNALLEIAMMVLALMGYDALYNHVGLVAGHVHFGTQVAFDNWLGRGVEPTVRLQHWLYRPDRMRPWDVLALLVYCTHFFAWVSVAIGLRVAGKHAHARKFLTHVVVLTSAGYLTYVAWPAAPPWYVAIHDGVGPVVRTQQAYFVDLGHSWIAQQFSTTHLAASDFGALPSLHAGYTMLLLLFFWNSGRRVRMGLTLLVLAMGASLVYSGEHFVFDILVGWAYAGVCFAGVEWVARRTRSRRGHGVARTTAR